MVLSLVLRVVLANSNGGVGTQKIVVTKPQQDERLEDTEDLQSVSEVKGASLSD